MSKTCIINFLHQKKYKILFLKQRKKKKKREWDILFYFHILLSNWKRFPVPMVTTFTVSTFTYTSEPTLNQFTNSLTLLSHESWPRSARSPMRPMSQRVVPWDIGLVRMTHEIFSSVIQFFSRNTKILIP